MPSFYVSPRDVLGDRIILRGAEFHHAVRVRRCRPGDVIRAIDGMGCAYRARIEEIGEGSLTCEVLEELPGMGEPKVRVTLGQSLVKGDRFDWVVEKGTEIGLSAILPVVASRNVVTSVSGSRVERWRRIALSAVKQCGRSRVPDVMPPAGLESAVSALSERGPLIVAWEGERGRSLREVVRDLRGESDLGLLIGPEGGFTDDEIDLVRSSGGLSFSLGTRLLRSETAGIVAAAILLYELGELGPQARLPCSS